MPSSISLTHHARRLALRARRLRRSLRPLGVFVLSVALVGVSVSLGAVSAQAASLPTLSQVFSPSKIYAAGSTSGMSMLQVTVSKPASDQGGQYNGLTFKVNLPGGLSVALGAVVPSCGGSTLTGGPSTTTPPAKGDTSFTWTGHLNPAALSCVVSVPVIGTVGTYTSLPSSFVALGGSVTKPSTSATLTVVNNPNGQPDWGVCPSAGFLFQNVTAQSNLPSQVTSFSLEPGSNGNQTVVGWTKDYVNAVGFNQNDGYMWGWDWTHNDLVRIGSDLSLYQFPLSAGLAALAGNTPPGGYNIGDVSPDGIMYLSSDQPLSDGNQAFVIIDLTGKDASGQPKPTVTKNIELDSSPDSMADWAYDKITASVGNGQLGNSGALWGVGFEHAAPHHPYLFQTTASGAVNKYADLTGSGIETDYTDDSFGADYIDSNNNLYVSNNQTGNLYKIPLGYGSNTYKKMSRYVPGALAASGNDGARCSSASVTPPTLTLNKIVPSLVNASDGFKIQIQDTLASATIGQASTTTSISPSSTTVQATTGAQPGTETDTYVFSETGLGATDLSKYTTTFSCVDTANPLGSVTVSLVDSWTYDVKPGDGQVVVCTFTNTAGQQSPTLQAKKLVTSVYDSSDQFEVVIADSSANALASADTPSSGLTKSSSDTDYKAQTSVVTGVTNQTYTFSEEGLNSTSLANYVTSYSCVDTARSNDAVTTSPVGTTSQTFTVTPSNGQVVVCTFTNQGRGAGPPLPVISITKSSTNLDVRPGGQVSYQVMVTNAGQVAANGVDVEDSVPDGIASFDSWTCTGYDGASCEGGTGGVTTGTGSITGSHVDLPVSGYVIYTISATANEGLLPGLLINQAEAIPPAGLCSVVNSTDDPTPPCFASKVLPTVPAMSLHKNVVGRENSSDQFGLTITDGTTSLAPTAVTTGSANGLQAAFVAPVSVVAGTAYTISETAGNSTTQLSDYTQAWSCTDEANNPGMVFASGTTTTDQVTVPTQTTYVPDVVCTFENTAIAPAISVTKTESSSTIVPGGSITYTVTVANTGTVAADGTKVTDPIPAGIVDVTSWSCAGSSTATGVTALSCPSTSAPTDAINLIDDTYSQFPAGQVFTYTITAKADDALTADVTNTVTATPPPTGFCTSGSITSAVGVACAATVTATTDQPQISAQKHITSFFDATDQFKVSLKAGGIAIGSANTVPGTTGDQAAVGPFSAVATSTYTVSEDLVTGTGAMSNYDVAVSCVDTLDSTVTVTTSVVQGTGSNRYATFTVPTGVSKAAHVRCIFTNTALFSQVKISKTLTDSTQKLVPGGEVDYTLAVTNTGSISANGTVVKDPIPTGIQSFDSWTCAAAGGAVCPTDTTFIAGSGAISETITTFPAGGSITYKIKATAVLLSLPSSITNKATADPPPHGTCADGSTPPCPASVSIDASPALSLSKTVDGRVNASDQFTISLSGPAITGTVTADTSGTGTGADQADIAQQAVTAGETYTLSESGVSGSGTDLTQYTSTYVCRDAANGGFGPNGAPIATGTLDSTTHSGSVTIPNDAGQATPNVECVIENTPNTPLLSITKTTLSTLTPGGSVVYTVTVKNAGTVPADGSEFTDAAPTGIAQFDSWTCTSSLPATSCPQTSSSGPGDIDQILSSFPVGQVFTYTINATAGSAPSVVTNTAKVMPPPNGGCADGSSVPCQAQATLSVGPQSFLWAQKSVVGTIDSTDQFELKVSGGSIPANSVVDTTAGASGSWRTGLFATDATSSYTVSETFLHGNPLNYSTQWFCADATAHALLASGTGLSTGPFTMPTEANAIVKCAFVNTALPQTITVKKDIESYYSSSDKFTVRVDGGSILTNNTATTNSYPATGVVATTPAVPVSAGTTYTISESAASGSLANYDISYQCLDASGTAVPGASGTGVSSFTLTMPTAVPPAQIACTFTNTARPTVSIAKSTTNTKIVPGGAVNYTVTVTNTSPLLPANGTSFVDPLPAGIDRIVSVSCSSSPANLCPANAAVGPWPTGITTQTIPTFPAGASVTYTISAIATVVPVTTSSPSVVNTATVTPPNGDPGCTLPSGGTIATSYCTSSVTTPVEQPTVTVQKNVVSYFSSSDQFQTKITGALITVNNTANTTLGQTGVQAKVSPALNATAGTSYDAFETATVGTLTNYDATFSCVDTANSNAAVSTTTDANGYGVTFTVPTPATNAAKVLCTITNTARTPSIGIVKTVTEPNAIPGGVIHYSLTVTNTGLSDANGTVVQDSPPTGIQSFTAWTCSATGSAQCANASGSGSINETITKLPSNGLSTGDSVTFAITAKVAVTATGTIINTGYATPPPNGGCSTGGMVLGRCPASVPITVDQPTVSIQKDVVSYYSAGDKFQMTVTGSNITSNNVATTTVGQTGFFGIAAPLPALPGGLYTVTETALAGSVGNYSVSYQCTDTANSSSVVSGSGQTSFTFTMPTPTAAAGKVMCVFTNTAKPSVALTKTTTNTDIQPNGPVTYVLTVTGTSLVTAVNTAVRDAIPTGIQSFTGWTCVSDTGALCGNGLTTSTGPAGTLTDSPTSIPFGGHVVYTISAIATSSPPTSVTNTATATPVSPGFCSTTNTAVCTASVTVAPKPVISITKTADLTSVKPNDTINYTIVVTNTGVQPTSNVLVTDTLPAGLTAFTNVVCSNATGGAACPTVTATGDLNATIASFPSGASVTFTITATVSSTPPANIENVAKATPPSSVRCSPGYTTSPCTALVDTPSVPIVTVTKAADLQGVVPGSVIHYTVIASNVGTVSANGSELIDPVPSGLTNSTWTCAPYGPVTTAVCPNQQGSGDIHETILVMPAGSALVYNVTATVNATPPASIVNNVTFDPHGNGVCGDPGYPPPPCGASVPTPVLPQVSVTKTADRTVIVPSGSVVYTVTITNTGRVDAGPSVLSDPIPTGLVSFNWTCKTVTGNVSCPTIKGTTALNETINPFPAGASLEYDVTARVTDSPPAMVTNTATLMPPSNALCSPDNTPGPCLATLSLPGPVLAFTGVVLGASIPLALSSILGGGIILIILSITRRRRAGQHAAR